MDNDILPIIIAGRVDAADDEELLIAIEGIKDVLQLGAQRARQGEIPRADSREGQSQICSQSLILRYSGRRIPVMHTREVSHAVVDIFSLVRGEMADVWTLPIEFQDPLDGSIFAQKCVMWDNRGLRGFPRGNGLDKGIGVGGRVVA